MIVPSAFTQHGQNFPLVWKRGGKIFTAYGRPTLEIGPGLASPVNFVVDMNSTASPCFQLFHISRKKNQTFPLNQNLKCATYCIGVASCVICNQQCVGQTINKISTKWSAYQGSWNKPDKSVDSDQMAVSRHYTVFHGILNKPRIYDSYTVTLAKQRSFDSLDST